MLKDVLVLKMYDIFELLFIPDLRLDTLPLLYLRGNVLAFSVILLSLCIRPNQGMDLDQILHGALFLSKEIRAKSNLTSDHLRLHIDVKRPNNGYKSKAAQHPKK